jgi:TM2 domain-containing membrane protein YozV
MSQSHSGATSWLTRIIDGIQVLLLAALFGFIILAAIGAAIGE